MLFAACSFISLLVFLDPCCCVPRLSKTKPPHQSSQRQKYNTAVRVYSDSFTASDEDTDEGSCPVWIMDETEGERERNMQQRETLVPREPLDPTFKSKTHCLCCSGLHHMTCVILSERRHCISACHQIHGAY